MFSYIVYGLGVHSALSLPELVASEAGTDVVIRLGNLDPLLPESVNRRHYLQLTPEEAYLFWENVGTFLVRGGHEIVIEPVPGVDERVLRLFLLGSAFGVLLHQRGLLTLHASAVAVNGGAVAFLGGKGHGKSATAAAFHARGCGIVADDVVVVNLCNTENPTVLPGFPQVKLWPDSVVALGDDPEVLPRIHPELEKRAWRVADGFPQKPLPLKRVYILDGGPTLEIESIRPRDAFVELVRHWYGMRFGNRLLQTVREASSHFFQCASLANTVTIRRLRRPRSLLALPDLACLVEADLAHEGKNL